MSQGENIAATRTIPLRRSASPEVGHGRGRHGGKVGGCGN